MQRLKQRALLRLLRASMTSDDWSACMPASRPASVGSALALSAPAAVMAAATSNSRNLVMAILLCLGPATLLPMHANPSLPIRFACLLQHWCHSARVSSCRCPPRGLSRSRTGRRCSAGPLGGRLGDQFLKAIAAVAACVCSGHGQRMRQREAPARRLAVGHAAADAAAARRAGMRCRRGGAALWHGGGPGAANAGGFAWHFARNCARGQIAPK